MFKVNPSILALDPRLNTNVNIYYTNTVRRQGSKPKAGGKSHVQYRVLKD